MKHHTIWLDIREKGRNTLLPNPNTPWNIKMRVSILFVSFPDFSLLAGCSTAVALQRLLLVYYAVMGWDEVMRVFVRNERKSKGSRM